MIGRRRFLSIVAACAALTPVAGARATPSNQVRPVVWKGTALGALASMTLVAPDRARAQALVRRCVGEIDRLESVFSLYRRDSALSRLNAAGELRDPPLELVELLSQAIALARASGGAFDPTVQPLYRLYAEYHAAPGASAAGPSAAAIAAALRDVGFGGIELTARRVHLRSRGMAITLNGIAQGFITDRVADLLRDAGLADILIDLGEVRAHGRSGDGAPWRAALADPRNPRRSVRDVSLGDAPGMLPALATSAASGTVFGSDPRVHHLFDPATGRSANHYLSVSVSAPRAALADGLSTALSVLPPRRATGLLAAYPSARAWFLLPDGTLAQAALGKDSALASLLKSPLDDGAPRARARARAA